MADPVADLTSGVADNYRVRGNVLRDHCARTDDGASADPHPVEDNRPIADPNIVLYHDPLPRNSLFINQPIGIRENMVFGQQINRRPY